MNDDQTTAPSAETQQEESVTLSPESMTDAQRAKWLETGELPTPEKEESAPSESAGDEPETPLATDGETNESTQDESRERKPKKGAESRKAQLSAEIQDLLAKRAKAREEYEAELAELEAARAKKQAKSPDASGEPPASGDTFDEPEPEPPNEDDFEDLESLRKAEREYERKARAWEARRAVFEERRRQTQQADQQRRQAAEQRLAQEWAQKVQQAKARYKDFEQVAFNEKLPLNPKAVERIPRMTHGADVLHYLGSHPDQAAELARLGPDDTVLALADIERAIATTLPKTKTVTGALPPPPEIGGSKTTPDDPVEAALSAGDFARYQELMNKRDAAALRGS
jgi:hypothetical protein